VLQLKRTSQVDIQGVAVHSGWPHPCTGVHADQSEYTQHSFIFLSVYVYSWRVLHGIWMGLGGVSSLEYAYHFVTYFTPITFKLSPHVIFDYVYKQIK